MAILVEVRWRREREDLLSGRGVHWENKLQCKLGQVYNSGNLQAGRQTDIVHVTNLKYDIGLNFHELGKMLGLNESPLG